MYGIAFLLLPAFFLHGGHDIWNLPRWVLATAFLCVALPVAVWRGPVLRRVPRLVWVMGVVWLGWTALSLVNAWNFGDAAYVVGLRLTGVGMVLWLGMQRDVGRIMPWLVLLCGLEVVVGLGEMAGEWRMNDLLKVPIGTVGNQNLYGCVMALLVPFGLMWGMEQKGRWRVMGLVLAVLAGGMAVLSGSKSAVLAMGVAGLVVVGWHGLKVKTNVLEHVGLRRFVLVFGPVVLGAVPVLWSWTGFETGDIHTEQTTGTTERGMIWRESIDMVGESPLIGSGPGSWKYKML
ncbi:MAG: O-antigen ligase family protein, partial [Bacteroidota bacterium]